MATPYAHSADGGALKTTLHLTHLAAAIGYTTVMAVDCAEAIKTGRGWPIYFLSVGTFGLSFAFSLVFCVVKGAVQTLAWSELPSTAAAAVWWTVGFVLIAKKSPPPSVRLASAVAGSVVWALLGAVVHDRLIVGRETRKGVDGGGGGGAGGDGAHLGPTYSHDAEVDAVA